MNEAQIKARIARAHSLFQLGRITRRERDARILKARQALSKLVHDEWKRGRDAELEQLAGAIREGWH